MCKFEALIFFFFFFVERPSFFVCALVCARRKEELIHAFIIQEISQPNSAFRYHHYARLINVITAIGVGRSQRVLQRHACLSLLCRVVNRKCNTNCVSVCVCIFEWLGDFSCFFHVKVASRTRWKIGGRKKKPGVSSFSFHFFLYVKYTWVVAAVAVVVVVVIDDAALIY